MVADFTGNYAVNNKPRRKSKIVVLSLLGLILAVISGVVLMLVAVVYYFLLPVAYHYPDGTCAIVVEKDGTGRDCGWEEGKSYTIHYIHPQTDLSTLHNGGKK